MSDHSSEFVSHFFCSLGTTLDMRLHLTSGYHLEACYESPKKELTSYAFEHLIYNLKSYNGIEI